MREFSRVQPARGTIMAKKGKSVSNKPDNKKPEAKAAPVKAAATAVQAKPQVLVVVKKDAKLRGARDLWYQRLVEHDGKPVDTFVESAKNNPPSLPKSGKAEAPGGWLSYFKRQGIVEVRTA